MDRGEGEVEDHQSLIHDVYMNFTARRAGIIKALTTTLMNFIDSAILVSALSSFTFFCVFFGSVQKDVLCLYGLPTEEWEVRPPPEEVPSDLPEPALGINFVRDRMIRSDWLDLIAAHSDSWLLLTVTFI
ncbi:Alfin [Trema orientale]|uniref:PHD finger protein ALFIN-LIKE n=1 Tax=Trema orientale TaxID=63057 RepID=A0A2P5CCA9_TREOI|nr:Alfin [Trema orientale]